MPDCFVVYDDNKNSVDDGKDNNKEASSFSVSTGGSATQATAATGSSGVVANYSIAAQLKQELDALADVRDFSCFILGHGV